ncbi:MAG: LacI family DNA-binding transcriptional regulator [Actinomycetes bacterium]
MSGPSSITDVARRAGVSIATVSRSLRGLPNVSPVTRTRVLRAAAELDYVVSPAASRLASRRTGTIGVVVPFARRWFFSQVLGAVAAVLREAGMDLLLYDLADRVGREEFFDRLPLRRRVDGVLVISLGLTSAEAKVLRELGVPAAIVGVRTPWLPCVRIDDVEGSAKAVRHLVNLGHQRIGMLSSGLEDPTRSGTPTDRRTGYRKALREAGLAHDPTLEHLGAWGPDGGAEAMADLLALPDPPTAVFAESDEMAVGAMRTLRRAGLRVPDDVSVVGFDDHEIAGLVDLTTVRQPVAEQGEHAAILLLDAVANGPSEVPSEIVLPTRLIVRSSSTPPRIRTRWPGPAEGLPTPRAHER